MNFPTLKSDRIILRELKTSDWKSIQYLRSDAIVNQFVKRKNADTKEKALAFINKIQTNTKKGDIKYWAISLINHSEMIGSICLWNFSKDGKKAELGYDLATEHQNIGIMNEALNMVIDFGFKKMNIEKVEAYTQFQNIPSLALLEKNGFKKIKNRVDKDNPANVILELIR